MRQVGREYSSAHPTLRNYLQLRWGGHWSLLPMRWLPASVTAAALYLIVGRVFAWPTNNGQVWRLAAWVVSGVVFTVHIAYESLKLRHPARSTAYHVTLAVGLGSLALAVAGMVNDLVTTSTIRPNWLIALVAWPAITAIPAFFSALVAAVLLSRITGWRVRNDPT